MRKISLTKLLIAIATFLFFESYAQNVGISADGVAPHPSAMLDIDVSALNANSKKGLLIPRISLQSTSDQTTIPTPATGLLVYNTNGSITSGNGVGFYYFNGTSWVSLLGSNSTSVSQGVKIGFSSSTTWTCPAGVTQIKVELWGGGGGGGANYVVSPGSYCSSNGANTKYGGDGGRGGYNYGIITVIPGQAYNILIGLGGSAGPYTLINCNPGYFVRANGNALDGGSSSFGGLLTAQGGFGGTGATSSANGMSGSNGTILNWPHPSTNYGSRSYIPPYYLNAYPLNSANSGSRSCNDVGCLPSGGENGYCVISY